MDKTILLEKRKNLIDQNKNSPEIYLKNDFLNILNIVDYDELIKFIFDENKTKINISKGKIAEKLKNDFNKIFDIETLRDYLNKQNINIDVDENKDLIFLKQKYEKQLLDKKLKTIEQLKLLDNEAKV